MAASKNKYSFENSDVPLEILKQRAYNYRWATLDEGVIPLTAADPDYEVAEEITDGIKEYISNRVFSYGPSEGLPVFKEAICNWYSSTKNCVFDVGSVLPVNSAAAGLFIAASAILQKGDEAIIFEPVDFLFRKAIENAGATVVTSTLNKVTGEINSDELTGKFTDKTKALFICNPNNPLGKTMTKSDLLKIGTLAQENGCTVVSDEIWADINYDNSFISIAAVNTDIKNISIVISGLSKNFGLAGLRIGYMCVANNLLFEKVFNASLHKTTAFGISTLSQIAGTSALNNGKIWLSNFTEHLAKAKKFVENRINTIAILKSNDPNATYLSFPKIQNCKLNSEALCAFILKNAKVAVIPGGDKWFEGNSEGHIRICYATSIAILEESFDRIDKALTKL